MARSVLLINTWFGPYPRWMPAFLQSCAANPDVDWLLFTDHRPPAVALPNVRFERLTLDGLNALATEKLGAPVQIQHSGSGKGKVVVSYHSLDELDGILAHLR